MAHQEYPRHLHRPDGTYCIVGDDAAKEAKLAEGWNLQPGAAPVVASITTIIAATPDAQTHAHAKDPSGVPVSDVLLIDSPEVVIVHEPAPKKKRGRKPKDA